MPSSVPRLGWPVNLQPLPSRSSVPTLYLSAFECSYRHLTVQRFFYLRDPGTLNITAPAPTAPSLSGSCCVSHLPGIRLLRLRRCIALLYLPFWVLLKHPGSSPYIPCIVPREYLALRHLAILAFPVGELFRLSNPVETQRCASHRHHTAQRYQLKRLWLPNNAVFIGLLSQLLLWPLSGPIPCSTVCNGQFPKH